MTDDQDMTDWAPGQPPPWLQAYGPDSQGPGAPPIQSVDTSERPIINPVLAPSIPPPVPPPPPPPPPPPQTIAPAVTAKGEEVKRAAGLEQPPIQPASSGPDGQMPQFVPPWLQAMTPPGPDAVTGAMPTPPPAPDAISGGAQPTGGESPAQTIARVQAETERTVTDPNASIADRQKAFANLTPEQRTRIVNGADPNQLAAIASAAMSPDDLAVIAVRHQQQQFHLQSAAQLELARQRDEAAARDYQNFIANNQRAAAATAQIEAEAQKQAQLKVDPEEHGVGRFIADTILAGIGGAMSQYTGGRNLALEQLNKNTQRRIDAQTANIANGWKGLGIRQNLVGEQLKLSGDLYHAQEVYRISQYDRGIAELQTKYQDYDNQGTTAMRIAGTIQQAQAQRQQALAAIHQQKLKDFTDLSKQVGETAAGQVVYGINGPAGKTDADIAKTRAETGKTDLESLKLAGQLGGSGVATADLYSPDKFPGQPVPPKAWFDAMGGKPTIKQYSSWLETSKKGQELSGAQTTASAEQNASTINMPHGDFAPVTYASGPDKGRPILLPKDIAKDVNDVAVATQQTIDSLADVRQALEADPSTFDRKKWSAIQARIGGSLPTLAKIYGAKFSSREETALKDITNLDYDSYRKRVTDKGTGMASIDAIIDTLKRNGNTEASAKLHQPVDLFLDTSKPKASEKTEIDKLTEKLSIRGTESSDEALNAEIRKTDPYYDWELQNDPRKAEQARYIAAQTLGNQSGHTEALQRLDKFAHATAVQHSGGWFVADDRGNDLSTQRYDSAEKAQSAAAKFKSDALGAIGQAANNSMSGDVQDAASELLSRLMAESVPVNP